MVKNTNIINFHEARKDRFLKKEKTKKMLIEPELYDNHLLDSEIARLRNELGLDKKEEKK